MFRRARPVPAAGGPTGATVPVGPLGLVGRIPALGALLAWLWRNPLLAPALLVVILVTQVPFALTVVYSLFRWNLQRPENTAFVGFGNYVDIFGDERFLGAVVTSLSFTVSAVLLSLLLGTVYAVLVHERFPGRGIVRTLFVTPFLIMPIIGALAWKYTVLNPIFGVLNWIVRQFGALPVDWLGMYPVASVVAVLVWRWAPFVMIIVLAGLQALDESQREAARIDGAGPWDEFRYVVLPHLKRYLQLAALLASIFVVNEFDVIFMLTQGGPGTATTNVPFLIYQTVFYGFDVGRAAAMAVVIVLGTIAVVTYLLKLLSSLMEGLD